MCRIIFHFFRFYYAEKRRKLWPKAPAKEGALGQMSTNFQVYSIHVNFFKKPDKKIYNRAKKFYCNATIYIFLISYYLYLPKKKWKLINGPRLSTLPYSHMKSIPVYDNYIPYILKMILIYMQVIYDALSDDSSDVLIYASD